MQSGRSGKVVNADPSSDKSDLAAAESFYLRTLHGPRTEEISVGIANVNLADARLQEAEKALRRTQQLHEGFTVTRVQIDQAQRDARMAAALLDEMHAKLALLKAGYREEDITEARSRRDAAKGRVEETAARLGYCSVDAPISGIVLSTNVSPGQLVSTMVPVALLTMVDDSTRRVRTFVDESEISTICLHQRARVTADAVPGIQMDGIVENIGALDAACSRLRVGWRLSAHRLAGTDNAHSPPSGGGDNEQAGQKLCGWWNTLLWHRGTHRYTCSAPESFEP
jgi:multidrug resistance efflux pump